MAIVNVPPYNYPSVRPHGSIYFDAVTLDAADEFLVCVLKVPKSGTLKKIAWVTGSTMTVSGFVFKISLETVATTVGEPVALTNAGKTLYATGAESADITSLSASTIYYTEINGSTGISVTVGDHISVTFRLVSVTSGAMTIRWDRYGSTSTLLNLNGNDIYTANYTGSWQRGQYPPILGLEYSDGMCPAIYLYPPAINNIAIYNSGSNPDRRGMKFKVPYKCRLFGCNMRVDTDGDCQVLLYDSDEYTVMSGFPITITSTKRATSSVAEIVVPFGTKPTIEADTWYRIVLLPTSGTDIGLLYLTFTDDGTVLGIDACVDQQNCIYTTFNGAPSSGSHSWTDSVYKPTISLIIDGIETGGAAGGLLRHPGMQGGLNA